MSRSNVIIIKCPGCSDKFQAERQEETSYVNCPECAMQVKIGGMAERRRVNSHTLPTVAALPSKRVETRLKFEDLSKSNRTQKINLTALKKEATESGYLGKKVTAQLADRADLELDDADVLEDLGVSEGIVPVSKPFPLSTEEKVDPAKKVPEASKAPPETTAKVEVKTSESVLKPDSPKLEEASAPGNEEPSLEATSNVESGQKEESIAKETAASEEQLTFEKIQVGTAGKRRVLRNAPVAEVPEPKGKGLAGMEVLRINEDKPDEPIIPNQDFSERRISEGAEWRRHKPKPEEGPQWEGGGAPNRRTNQRALFRGIGLGLAMLAAALVAAFVVRALFPDEKAKNVAVPAPAPHKYVTPTITEIYPKAVEVIRKFLESSSNEEALQYVRSASRVAIRMKRFYPRGEFEPSVNYKIGSYDLGREKDGFMHLPITLDGGKEKEISVELSTSRIDWESWVGFCETPFAEFRDRRVTLPTLLRVFLVDDDYYNFEFNDREKFRSVRVFDSNQEHSLWGYFRKQSPAYHEAGHYLVSSDTGEAASREFHPVIVRAKFPEKTVNPHYDQVEISEFVKMGWVLPEDQ